MDLYLMSLQLWRSALAQDILSLDALAGREAAIGSQIAAPSLSEPEMDCPDAAQKPFCFLHWPPSLPIYES